MERRLGASEYNILVMQSNIACTYRALGRFEEAVSLQRDAYFGFLKLKGEEHRETLTAANNYAQSLIRLERFEEARSLTRKRIPVARRVLEESDELTFKLRRMYAQSLYRDAGATLDDLREAVTTLEEATPIARRVLGGAHPQTGEIEHRLREARAALRARETQSPGSAN